MALQPVTPVIPASPAGQFPFNSSLTIGLAGNVTSVKSGQSGLATLVAGTVVVTNTFVTANSRIFLSAQDTNTTGALKVSARTAGTSFTITSSGGSDTGVVAWFF